MANTLDSGLPIVSKPTEKPSDYWADWEGIPLCHDPKTSEEWAELDKKGACRCG